MYEKLVGISPLSEKDVLSENPHGRDHIKNTWWLLIMTSCFSIRPSLWQSHLTNLCHCSPPDNNLNIFAVCGYFHKCHKGRWNAWWKQDLWENVTWKCAVSYLWKWAGEIGSIYDKWRNQSTWFWHRIARCFCTCTHIILLCFLTDISRSRFRQWIW